METPDSDSFIGLRDRAILELFYSSGIRLSELTGLNVGDIDFNNLSRIDTLQKAISKNNSPKILIDHHPKPDDFADFTISDTSVSSTAELIFEFITKQRAREFYNQIKEIYDNVYELSGDDNKAYRQYVINKTKEDKPIIIVATQVIEAGVDIDMDLGFKDISTLDSEEQFMGRINRSCKKENAKVYFFDIDDVSKIYKGDNRLGFDLTKEN